MPSTARLVGLGTAVITLVAALPATSAAATRTGWNWQISESSTAASAAGLQVPVVTTEAASPRLRAVPAWATEADRQARTQPGNGATDVTVRVPTPAGTVPLWGDWDGNGTWTPGTFRGGVWSLYDTALGPEPSPRRSFRYGRPGDRPVVGDWNGDGRTDIAVVRAAVWYQRDAASAGATRRTFRYGIPSDTPVAGDWDGDGRDSIGVHRGKRWFLRDAVGGGVAHRVFSYGRLGDLPVVGDWDGDGADGVGLVRDQSWYLWDAASPGLANRTQRLTRPPAAEPLPWPVAPGATGSSCPTAAVPASGGTGATSAGDAADLVVPSERLDQAPPTAPAAEAVRSTLLAAQRYLTGTRFRELHADRVHEHYLDVVGEPQHLELRVRPPAMTAVTLAIGLRTGAFSSEVGVSAADASAYAGWLVRSVACQHASVTPGGWGYGWQTAHWAMLGGYAGWLLWDELTPQARRYVASMVATEADVLLRRPPRYWRGLDGSIISFGDSAAEENAWNAAHLSLAAAMMPGHERAALWRAKGVQLAVASYARHSDLDDPAEVNGIPLGVRLSGSNVYDDGTLDNHGGVHPDYMSAIQHNWWAVVFAGLAEQSYPVGMVHNADLLYGAVVGEDFTSPPYRAPGGTIYRLGEPVYYPDIIDWGSVRRAHWMSFDAHAALLGLDEGRTDAALDYLAQHADEQLALQARFADGRSYLDSSEERYQAGEEYAAHQLAFAWMALYAAERAPAVADASAEPLVSVRLMMRDGGVRPLRGGPTVSP